MQKRQIAASSLGNILEWLDFGLFLFLAPTIGALFFPSTNANASKLAALSVFAGGFLCRPLGGIIFGHLGDRYGRARPLRFSIFIITVSTLLIGLLPSYEKAGIASAIFFTALRLVQGLAIGGEYSGVMTYLVESAAPKSRGFVGSFAATGANLGFLLATLMILLLQKILPSNRLIEGGWRFPFIIIGLIGTILTFYRLRLLETPVFEKLKKEKKTLTRPLLTAFKTATRPLLIIFALNGMSCGFYYVFFGFMPEYLHSYLKLASSQAFELELLTLTAMLMLVPLMGFLGDRFGRKKMLLITTLSMMGLALPLFYLLNQASLPWITLALAVATLLSSLDQGNTLTSIVDVAPAHIRYSSIAFSYNVSSAIFGGLSPLIVMLLIEKINVLAPSYYILFTSLLGFIAVLSLKK